MIELNVKQGSREWLDARAKCLTASEAPAMMGVSTYMTRSELLRQKATGIVPNHDAATLARFNAGHDAEAKARPIVESIIGEQLFPIVATDDSGKYLASSDGATMLIDAGFEHKLWNEALAEEVRNGNVPESHRWQLDHQIMVFGFSRILFVVSNGTAEKMVHCWYYKQQDRIEKLVAGWEQFEKDVATYQPDAVTAAPVGSAPGSLPALFIQVSGAVQASNLADFKAAAMARFAGIKTDLKTDEDFADAEATVKWCADVESKLAAAKNNALGQTASIDALFKAIDDIAAEARRVRLDLDKKVKAEKENRKAELVREAQMEFQRHVYALTERCGVQIPASGFFGEAIKGLKSLASMKDKLGAALANAKVEANATADRIDANRKAMGENAHLFPDFAQVCQKAPDDFAAIVGMRINQRKEAEEKRIEAERERIRAEEQAKAQREAAEAMRKQQEDERLSQKAIDDESSSKTIAPIIAAEISARRDREEPGPTMKLGEINARLGVVSVTADQLATLGIHPVSTERSAKLYSESSFPTICRLISERVMSLAFKKAA